MKGRKGKATKQRRKGSYNKRTSKKGENEAASQLPEKTNQNSRKGSENHPSSGKQTTNMDPLDEETLQLQQRAKKINQQIGQMMLFVAIFCLATFLLNTYHIHRLKLFGKELAELMEVHAETISRLNVAKQIKDNFGISTIGPIKEPYSQFYRQKADLNASNFRSQKKFTRPRLFPKLSEEQTNRTAQRFSEWLARNSTLVIGNLKVDLGDFDYPYAVEGPIDLQSETKTSRN